MSQHPATDNGPCDAELIAACRDGRKTAFDTLVGRHQDRAYSLAYRLTGNGDDAAEAVQEAFLKAWRAMDRFKGEASFYTWFYRIVVNVVRSRQRFRAVRPVEHSLDAPRRNSYGGNGLGAHIAARGPDPAETAGRRERKALVENGLARLDPENRMLIVLRDIQGHNYGEIAEVLECPRGTVKSRLHRARKALRAVLAPVFALDQEAAP